MMKSVYETVLFDLDGTLSQSDPGIINAVRYALQKTDSPVPEASVLRRMIGPPLWYGFSHVCGLSAEKAEQAVQYFRSYYDTKGVYENVLYPHMAELLQKLNDAGAKVCVASSKSQKAAELVVDYFKVRPMFACVSASDDNEKDCGKKVLIRRALEVCGTAPEHAVMIGDTRFDVEGAAAVGTDFIGMLYGYGTEQEMREMGALRFAKDVPELEKLLLVE